MQAMLHNGRFFEYSEDMIKEYCQISAKECLMALGSSKQGLSAAESAARIKQYGQNQLPQKPRQSVLVMFFKQFLDIMTLILLGAAAVSMVVSVVTGTKSELVDAFIILGIVLINAFIGFWQERKAERSMEELQNLTRPECKVLHDGVTSKIASACLAPGDVVVLEAGDIVPADVRLLESVGLSCDESALTGESVPAQKDAKSILPPATPLAEQKNMAFSGTVVASGRGLAVVTATGANSQIGKIAQMLVDAKPAPTPLQRAIKGLAKATTALVLAICVITFVVQMFLGHATVLDAFLTAVALAVAAIPESLLAVITIITSLGARRMARQKAIIKHLHAIETLGACQVICSDKTGTLTQNKITVQTLFCGGKFCSAQSFAPKTHEAEMMLKVMLLCESVEPAQNGWLGDPTELALVNFAESAKWKTRRALESTHKLFDELPFNSNRKMMTSIRQSYAGLEALTKGAVDELLTKCTHIEIDGAVCPLLPFHKEKILRANKEMASDALRVLAFAYRPLQSAHNAEKDLIFVGLAGMIDPPRPEVKRAVKKCHRAHVLPVMITGDHPIAGFAIAKQVGIATAIDQVITGAEIDKLSDAQFEKIILTKRVFARVSPENKVRIVETLKNLGKIVAMTGDGVNDAPSIRRAHIGIGMGQSGTDVTKEAADVIITDDNFASIIVAVEEGRKTFANIQKTVQFLFTANLAEITAIFLATLFWPSVVFLTPVQILFVNLISDTLPAIALGLEPAEKDLMGQPPRDASKGLLAGGVGRRILFVGAMQGLIMLSCFLFGLYALSSATVASTMAFYALNVVQFFYFISMRTNGSIWQNPITRNPLAVWAVASCFAFVLLAALTPLGSVLGLCALGAGAWLFIIFACAVTFVISEIVKLTVVQKK